jgi:hypothetical protein
MADLAVGPGLSSTSWGPVVRQRSGDAVEVIQESRLGVEAHTVLVGLTVAFVTVAMELLGGALGPWRYLLVGLATGLLPRTWQRCLWRRRWRFARTPRLERVDGTTATGPVRVCGVVEPEAEVFVAPGTQRPAVYARTLFWEPGNESGKCSRTAREDVRGVPFRLRMSDGTSLSVMPAAVRLLEPPAQLRDVPLEIRQALGAASRGRLFEAEALFRQTSLSPGDQVEAAGFIQPEVNVHGAAAFARGTPLALTLAPGPDRLVLIRRRG